MSTKELDSIVKRLILIRGLRSIGQGAMVVDLTLYLKDLNWSGISIGSVTSAAGIFGAILILFVGILSDRMGRKPFLLIYEGLTLMSAVAACFTTQAIILVFAIVVAGFGRGQSGAAGPFSPAEQAWLARHVNQSKRGLVFSFNNAVGFIGMAIGSIIGGIPAYLHSAGPLAAYRPVFILVAVASLICSSILLSMKEQSAAKEEIIQGLSTEARVKNRQEGNVQTESANIDNKTNDRLLEAKIRKQENSAMFKLALVNVLNGLAVGLTGPMMAYWFSIRYGVSSAEIGLTISISFILTGISSVLNGFLAQRVGMVKSVTGMRVIGSILMLTLPFMPNFTSASVLYVLRNAINRGTTGNRFALGASLTRDKRRGLATSINALSMRLPASLGPAITGYLFDIGQLSLPLILTAVLQLANAGVFQWVFGKYDKTSIQE
jgi:MFS family permease